MNSTNFNPMLAKALRNKAELAYCVDDWLVAVESNDLVIPLCEDAVKVLHDRLLVFRYKLLAMSIPALTAPNEEYDIDIFENAIQLGRVTWSEDAKFDKSGFCVAGESEYELLMGVSVPSVSIERWCEMNGVKPGTARQWVNRKRLLTKKEGRDLRISAIQYIPDAFLGGNPDNVRLDVHGALPASIVARYPFLGNNVLSVTLMGKSKIRSNVFVISKDDENEEPDSHIHTVSEAEREWLLRALLASDVVCCHSEMYYSPLPEASWAGKARFPVIAASEDEVKAFLALDITGKCYGTLKQADGPAFELTLGSGDYIRGNIIHMLADAENALMWAILDGANAELREGLINQADICLSNRYPWDEYVLLVTDMRVTPDANGEASVLKGVQFIVEQTCGARTTMTAFALAKEAEETDANARLVEDAGYREILPGDIYKWENRLFFGYTKF